jgi:hypothetical protein
MEDIFKLVNIDEKALAKYPQSFLDKMRALLKLEFQIVELPKEQQVPKRKKTLFFNNYAEVDRIEQENEKIRKEREACVAKRDQLREELKDEKQQLGLEEEFFFEDPTINYGYVLTMKRNMDILQDLTQI